jgi:ligand-binding sensor domain-containing protein
MLPLTVLIQVEIMRNFSVIQKINPQLFTQSELKYVIRDLGLPKGKVELLGSRLKEKNLLGAGTSIYWYRSREQEFTSYFSHLVYCCIIPGLI